MAGKKIARLERDMENDDEGEVERTYCDDEENNGSEDNRCGLGDCCSPQWLQIFASKKAFMGVLSALAVVQGMAWAYFSATITTLEKRLKISSQTAGIVMTGNETSQILFSLFLAHLAGRGHRPRWIAGGVLLSGISCIILASPHILYGAGNDALSLTKEYAHQFDPNYEYIDSVNASPTEEGSKSSKMLNIVQTCHKSMDGGSSGPGDCSKGDSSIIPLILIFLSQFVMGIGVVLFYTLGGPYLDDNIEKTKSPMVFGVTMSLRLVGPTLGFLFAAGCLKIYIAPSLTPLISNKDPRWIGAWWLGWVVLGCLMIVTSITIAMFPKELPRTVLKRRLKDKMKGSTTSLAHVGSQIISTAERAADASIPQVRDLPKALKSLLSNRINLFNNLAGIFYLFSAIGYWTYMPKYLETIFMQTAVSASVVSGVISILFQSIGLLLSGWLISKYQPSARMLAGWNVFLGFLYVAVKISFTQMGCEPGIPAFGDQDPNTGTWNLTSACNVDCNCKVNKIQPVCHVETGEIYYSACHAGCTTFEDGVIGNCSCLPNLSDTLSQGTCNQGCLTTFLLFLGVNALVKLLDSSGRIGNMLVSYRCVDPKEKSIAIGLSIFLISIFAMLPAPIVFGRILDSMCLVWGTRCGERGNCWLYEGEKLRYMFNLTAAAFTAVGAFFDFLVWYYVKDLDLYDEDKNVQQRLKSQSERSKT